MSQLMQSLSSGQFHIACSGAALKTNSTVPWSRAQYDYSFEYPKTEKYFTEKHIARPYSAGCFLSAVTVSSKSTVQGGDVVDFDDDSWLFDVQRGLSCEPKSIVLRRMFEAIQNHIHENDFEWIKWRLDILNPEIMHPSAIVAATRYSSAIRDDSKVGPRWKALVARSRVALLKRGLDAEKILRGML